MNPETILHVSFMAKAPAEAWELRCLLEMTDQILRKELADGVADPVDNVIPFPVASAEGCRGRRRAGRA